MIIEHDIIMATYLADRVVVYEGQPSVKARAKRPEALRKCLVITISSSEDFGFLLRCICANYFDVFTLLSPSLWYELFPCDARSQYAS